MTMRHPAAQALATRTAASQADHVRFGRRLVEEDEPRRVDPALAALPLRTSFNDVRAALLAGVERLF
jgi:hypothetical protein